MRGALAWTPVAVLAVWALLRVTGLERGYPLVPLMAFTPLLVPAGLVAAVLAAALGRRRAALAAGALALLLAALVAPRALGGPSDGGGPSIGVLSVNMLRGGADPEAIVALVRELDVEVLSLQETDAGGVDALREAGLDALLPHRVAFGVDVALLSSAPLVRVRAPAGFVKVPAIGRATFDGVPVEIAAVHLAAPVDGPRVDYLRDDLERLGDLSDGPPRILAGDFNATLDHSGLRGLLDAGYEDAADQVGAGLRATWPARRRFPPPVTIDHVLVDPRLGVGDFSVHTVPDSDHRAVFAEVILGAP